MEKNDSPKDSSAPAPALPAKTLKQKFSEKFIDLMALLTAIGALTVSVWQCQTQERLQVLDKQPVLLIEFHKIHEDTTKRDTIKKGLWISNVGFGPAEIVSYKVYKNREAYSANSSKTDILKAIGSELGLYVYENVLTRGYVIKQGDGFYLIQIDSVKEFNYSIERKLVDSLILELKYKSLSPFDEEKYYLRYGELFIENNIRDSTRKDQPFEYDAVAIKKKK